VRAALKRFLERLLLAGPRSNEPGLAPEREGRRVSLAVAREIEDTRVTEVATLVLELALEKERGFSLELRRADARDALARWLRVERPFTRSLGPLRVSAVFAPSVERLLGSRFAALTLEAFERFSLKTVAVTPGELRVTLAAAAGAEQTTLLALVDAMACTVEEVALRVTVTAESGSGRCAYCHDDGPELPCARCGARLHASCWADHGHCPVFACGGQPDPAYGWIPVVPVNALVARVDASPEGA